MMEKLKQPDINTNEYLPAILNGTTGIGVLLLSFLVEFRFPLTKEIAKPLGMSIVFAGISFAGWATVHLKEAILGEVEPRLDVLVKDGPYKWVRHPVHLGMTIALLGAAVALRSWLGLIGVFLLFLPSVIYRAGLEDKALARKFGSEWNQDAAKTGFFLPLVGKKRLS